jgi:putative addiction module component (TIGR02574 family)
MSIDIDALQALPVAEKLQLVEMLWDDLGKSATPIPLPEWVKTQVAQRRQAMADPSFGLSHEETWRRIAARNG